MNADPQLILIRGAEVFAPRNLGRKDILIAGGRIILIDDGISLPRKFGAKTINGKGMKMLPGLIDAHVHILGGGGEGGYKTRTPEIFLSQLIEAGITTIIGCLGTDAYSRTMSNLVAKARGLTEEGVTCYCYTGNYRLPVTTLTGSVINDLMHIDRIVGVGEIALSDHRSSQPTFDELARLAADARVGGMLSGKSGLINVHMGDGKRKFDLLNRVVSQTEIPVTQFLPTHVGRNPQLLEAAITWTKIGGHIDLTTSTSKEINVGGASVNTAKTVSYLLDQNVDPAQISFSSDAQGSLPRFDEQGKFIGLGVGSARSLFIALKKCVLEQGILLETVLPMVTSNPAGLLKMDKKGSISVGGDADLILVDDQFELQTVVAGGKLMMHKKKLEIKGTFE